MFEVLHFEYFQRALVAAALVGLVCPAIGVFLVLRRLSLIGDGLGHISFAGVAFGWLVGVYPLLSAALFAVAGAVGLEVLRTRRKEYADLVLAVLFYAGIALGVVFISASRTAGTNVTGFLFGSIITVSRDDLVLVGLLSLVVVLAVVVFFRPLTVIAFDEDLAQASGVPVRRLNLGLAVLTALTVVVGIRVVGVLLVAALMAVPVAAALQIARSFRATVVAAVVFGEISTVGGLLASYYLDIAPGGTIVVLAVLLFIGSIAGRRGYRRIALASSREAPVKGAPLGGQR